MKSLVAYGIFRMAYGIWGITTFVVYHQTFFAIPQNHALSEAEGSLTRKEDRFVVYAARVPFDKLRGRARVTRTQRTLRLRASPSAQGKPEMGLL